MGRVFIYNENQDLIWSGRNTITTEFENRLISGILRRVDPPKYCAVGSLYRSRTDTPWDALSLQSEFHRRIIDGTFVDPITNRCYLISGIRHQNANTTWRELGLFDGSEVTEYGDRSVSSCDSIITGSTRWQTGTDNTLLSDTSSPVEGTAILRLTAGVSDPLYRHDAINLFPSKLSRLAKDLKNTRLQFHISFSNILLLSAAGITVTAYVDSDGTNGWRWNIPRSSLISGRNHLDLYWKNSTVVGEAQPLIKITRIEISAPSRTTGLGLTLDRIRLFHDNANLLARVELNPPLEKVGGTLVVSWIIDPMNEVDIS